MDRRDFIKSGLLAAAVGAAAGPEAIAQEAVRQAEREQLSKDILNYNPQMQYRPMGRTGRNWKRPSRCPNGMRSDTSPSWTAWASAQPY